MLFSKFQCDFRGFNAQHCLITVIEIWQRSVDGGGQTGALLTDLSKTFDCSDNELLLAKLYAYGFDKYSLYLLTRIWRDANKEPKSILPRARLLRFFFGVPEDYILGPLLFNIYICDLFFENRDIDIINYAYDNRPYLCSSDLDSVIFKLQENAERTFRWIHNNNLLSNAEKSNLIVSSKKNLPL